MITIKIVEKSLTRTIEINGPMQLSKLLKIADLPLALPCGGNKTCGKCKIKVQGVLSRCTKEELLFLSDKEIADHYRLACYAVVEGDVTLYGIEENTDVLSVVTLNHQVTVSEGTGLAVDIGTTTVAMQLYELSTGQLLGESLRANAQEIYGADIISRIQYAMAHGHDILQSTIHQQLKDMAVDCMQQAGIKLIDKVVIAGHTVMLHFYEGLDTSGIAVAPFTPSSFFGDESVFKLCESATYLPSCMSAYVGADITCSVLSAEMTKHHEAVELLVDLGTNGEIVLNHSGVLYCASTAAGPAFEGANLAYGMRGGKGAIARLWLEGDQFNIQTLGDVEPKGICGSGVLDAVSIMLDEEIIDETGRIDESYIGYGEIIRYNGDLAWQIPNTSVAITQKDIRQVQLAKSAICAGILTLIDEVGIAVDDIEKFYVAGGFGYHMDKLSASNIGLFPKELEERTEIIGNGALSGAIALLLNKQAKADERAIIASAKEVILSGNKKFSDYYIDGMMFEEVEE